jgi:hypothetical protein
LQEVLEKLFLVFYRIELGRSEGIHDYIVLLAANETSSPA